MSTSAEIEAAQSGRRAMRDVIAVAAIVTALAAGLAACGDDSGGGSSGGKHEIALIIGVKGDAFYGSLSCGARQAAIENLAARGVSRVELTAVATGEQVRATLPAGKTRIIAFHRGPRTPSADLARARTAFPTSPLPTGMTDPELALDGDPDTAWRPGAGWRMVVDLGGVRQIGELALRWTHGRVRPVSVSVSDDGLTYRPVATLDSGRYVALQVEGWSDGDARLADLAVEAP